MRSDRQPSLAEAHLEAFRTITRRPPGRFLLFLAGNPLPSTPESQPRRHAPPCGCKRRRVSVPCTSPGRGAPPALEPPCVAWEDMDDGLSRAVTRLQPNRPSGAARSGPVALAYAGETYESVPCRMPPAPPSAQRAVSAVYRGRDAKGDIESAATPPRPPCTVRKGTARRRLLDGEADTARARGRNPGVPTECGQPRRASERAACTGRAAHRTAGGKQDKQKNNDLAVRLFGPAEDSTGRLGGPARMLCAPAACGASGGGILRRQEVCTNV